MTLTGLMAGTAFLEAQDAGGTAQARLEISVKAEKKLTVASARYQEFRKSSKLLLSLLRLETAMLCSEPAMRLTRLLWKLKAF